MKNICRILTLIIVTIAFFSCSSMGEKKENTNKEKLYGTYIGENGAYQKIEDRIAVCRKHLEKSVDWKGPVVGINSSQ